MVTMLSLILMIASEDRHTKKTQLMYELSKTKSKASETEKPENDRV